MLWHFTFEFIHLILYILYQTDMKVRTIKKSFSMKVVSLSPNINYEYIYCFILALSQIFFTSHLSF